MKMPRLQEINNLKTYPLLFKGINKNDVIGNDELADGINLDTKNLPAITPRLPMELLESLTSPSQYGTVEDNYYYINDNKFYYNGVEKLTLTDGRKTIIDFNGILIIFPDKKYCKWQTGTNIAKASFTGSGDLGKIVSDGEEEAEWFKEECGNLHSSTPDIDFAVVHYNRIFGIKDNYIYATNTGGVIWDIFEGTEMDSWSADVYSDGKFTAIASYQDHVIFFKRNLMYELFGYTPSQFRVIESSKIGCVDVDSIAEVRGVLYFVNEDGVQSYSGGFPRSVSGKLNLRDVTKANAISANGNYYVCIDEVVYIFDMIKTAWLPYLNMGIIDFAIDGEDVILLGVDKNVYKMETGAEVVNWEATTKNFDGGMFNKKYAKTIKLKAKLGKEAELSVYIAYDEREFSLAKLIKNTEKYHITHRDVKIQLPLRRCSNYQLKFVGTGDIILYGEVDILIGSDV